MLQIQEEILFITVEMKTRKFNSSMFTIYRNNGTVQEIIITHYLYESSFMPLNIQLQKIPYCHDNRCKHNGHHKVNCLYQLMRSLYRIAMPTAMYTGLLKPINLTVIKKQPQIHWAYNKKCESFLPTNSKSERIYNYDIPIHVFHLNVFSIFRIMLQGKLSFNSSHYICRLLYG